MNSSKSSLGGAAETLAPYCRPCKPCGGSGLFTSFSGRVLGKCYACAGAGEHKFKTSPDVRAEAKARREATDARKADAIFAKATAWGRENAAEYAWMQAGDRMGNGFASSLVSALIKYGSLTDGQLEAVQNIIIRNAARANENSARVASAPVVSTTGIESLFTAATTNGLKTPSIRISGFKFKPAKAVSVNSGALYVTDDQGVYMGKVMNGLFLRSRECPEDKVSQIVDACANPRDAIIKYGRILGNCGLCGRRLVDPVSIEAGIGPICAAKFGM